MANVSAATGLLYAFGGALDGIGKGMEKSGILAREEALKRLEIIAADARAAREISSREGMSKDEIASREKLNSADITSREGIAGRQEAIERDRIASSERIAGENRSSENTRAQAAIDANARLHPLQQKDGTLGIPDKNGVIQPLKNPDGTPAKGIKSADDAIEQMRAYNYAMQRNTTKNADGVAVVDWDAVAKSLEAVGYKDLAAAAKASVNTQPDEDLWNQVRTKWESQAAKKAGWFSTDETDFGKGGRDAWINLKALNEYRAKGGKGMPGDMVDMGTSAPASEDPAASGAPAAPAPGGADTEAAQALPPKGTEPTKDVIYNTAKGKARYLGNGQFELLKGR